MSRASFCNSRVTILVNRGFVPKKKLKPETRLKGQVRGIQGCCVVLLPCGHPDAPLTNQEWE